MPIDNSFSFPVQERKEWPVLPEDVYCAEILDIELKEEPNPYKDGLTEPRFRFSFILLEGETRGRRLWKSMSAKLFPEGKFPASTFFLLASAVMGRKLTEDDIKVFGPDTTNSLIGRQVRLVVKQETKDGVTKNKISGFMPIKEEKEKWSKDDLKSIPF